MKKMKNRDTTGCIGIEKGGCLPSNTNFVPNSDIAKREVGVPTWKAGTQLHFGSTLGSCQSDNEVKGLSGRRLSYNVNLPYLNQKQFMIKQ